MRTHERDWKSAPGVLDVAVFAALYRSPCVYTVHLKAQADVYIPSQLIDSWEPCALSSRSAQMFGAGGNMLFWKLSHMLSVVVVPSLVWNLKTTLLQK